MSTTCLLLIGDGRDDYRDRTLRSAKEHLPRFDHLVEVDDSDHKLGFAGAIREGWERIRYVDPDWVFHLELDFEFNDRVPVKQMIGLLERQPQLAQVSLKRQAWNDEEKAAGGIVELHPDWFEERSDGLATWTEHRMCFTTNPSVYPARLCWMEWPQEKHSEGVFTHQLLRDPYLRFAFWGPKYSPPMVEHVGEVRAGNGY